ncbi:hypothetical protein SARC_09343 [Sphaeroforma arctica JP610]|uniref:Uncharacterized protein n=1 Tax=Sphaeroforma arctica JP610 TaxID=667725 RepID=A0A0L0FP10_9EUKA|nr:hypothetical protein SARC_09343 [Sphaeroforma arctica JP610]KNC78216.1 hypothetical protein SARC_09343 [Sphaeroforma arctica JP610]|eukprot:XP_014152118.1 hypothetical protein SARC_09343 [Sphaeroforma arctica JP610]
MDFFRDTMVNKQNSTSSMDTEPEMLSLLRNIEALLTVIAHNTQRSHDVLPESSVVNAADLSQNNASVERQDSEMDFQVMYLFSDVPEEPVAELEDDQEEDAPKANSCSDETPIVSDEEATVDLPIVKWSRVDTKSGLNVYHSDDRCKFLKNIKPQDLMIGKQPPSERKSCMLCNGIRVEGAGVDMQMEAVEPLMKLDTGSDEALIESDAESEAIVELPAVMWNRIETQNGLNVYHIDDRCKFLKNIKPEDVMTGKQAPTDRKMCMLCNGLKVEDKLPTKYEMTSITQTSFPISI